MKNIKFIRANKTKFGGVERVSEELERQGIEHSLVHSSIPNFFPSWLRVILFNLQVCLVKKDSFYFSLERISCPDIYRAGDGVHKEFIKVENKSFLNPLHLVYLYLEKRCFKNAKVIIANSNMIKDQIINTYGISSKRIEVIYNGVKSIEYDYEKSYARLQKEFKLKDEKLLLYVGSGFKRKGVEEFLQIVSKLKVTNIKAFVIGKEKKINYYKELAQSLAIEDKIIFTGPRQDVNDFYTISDIFLFPTHYEPFSNIVLEAMMLNNVVITTKQNGASEVLDEQFCMENSKDFSKVKLIDELLMDDTKLSDIKLSNKKKVKGLGIETNVNKTLLVINKVMGN